MVLITPSLELSLLNKKQNSDSKNIEEQQNNFLFQTTSENPKSKYPQLGTKFCLDNYFKA